MRVLKSSVVEWQLSTPGRRLAFLAAAGILALLPAFEASRIATAITLSTSADPSTLQHALMIEPENAEIEHRLGMALFYSDAAADQMSGLDHLRRATRLDPREALYWSDLAAACEASRDASCASDAAARALAASPMTPRLYWSAANYDLRAGRETAAFANFQRLLNLDPAYAGPVFQTCVRLFGTSASVEQGILARNRNPHVSLVFINMVSNLGDEDAAYAEWRRLQSADYADHADYARRGDRAAGDRIAGDAAAANATDDGRSPLSLAEVEPYLDHLIGSGREHDAVSVWTDLQRLGVIHGSGSGVSGETGSPPPSDELVFNGGFERSPLNAGFDWRLNAQPFVATALSDASHGGSHSMRIEFTGDRNQEYQPLFQLVPVGPGRSYTLSAFARSQAITSDTGPRLRVRDLGCSSPPCLDLSTPGITSTTPWHAFTLSFTAGADTRFVQVSIWRPRSRGYPSEISGILWIDDVSMVEQPLKASMPLH